MQAATTTTRDASSNRCGLCGRPSVQLLRELRRDEDGTVYLMHCRGCGTLSKKIEPRAAA